MRLCLTPDGTKLVGRLRQVLVAQLDDIISSWPVGQAEALVQGIDLLMARSTQL